MAKFADYMKNIFYILLALYFAPLILSSLYKQYTNLLEPKTKVGLIKIKGVIENSSSYVKSFKEFFEDKDIKAILVRSDCSGSTAGSAQALFQEIKALKQEHIKPIITFIENICASGGYYIACATDHIIATPAAFIGSIGVRIDVPQLKEFIEQFKIKYGVIKTGEYKTVGDWMVELTPEQQAMLQNLCNDTYQQFTADVAQSRPHLQLDKADQWANGKLFTGRQAHKIGLIDELGSVSTAEKVIRQRALIEGEIEWVKPPKKARGLLEWFTEDLGSCIEKVTDAMVTGICNAVKKNEAAIKV